MADVKAMVGGLRRRKPIQTWWGRPPPARPIAEFVGELADRDQEAQGSVLGSAVRSGSSCSSCPPSVVIVSLIASSTSLAVRRRPAGEGLHHQGHLQRARGGSTVETRCGSCSRARPHGVGRSFARQGARRVLRGGVAAAGRRGEGRRGGARSRSPASCSSRWSLPRSSAAIRDLGGAAGVGAVVGHPRRHLGGGLVLRAAHAPARRQRPWRPAPRRLRSSAWSRGPCKVILHGLHRGPGRAHRRHLRRPRRHPRHPRQPLHPRPAHDGELRR